MKSPVAVFFAIASLAQAQSWQRVAYDDAGAPGNQPHLIDGSDWRFENAGTGDEALRTSAYGTRVEFRYAGLNPGAQYRAKLRFFSDAHREVRVTPGNETVAMEAGKPVEREISLPAASNLTLVVELISGPNAVVSEVEILSTDPTPLSVLPEPPLELPRLTPRPATVAGCATPVVDLGGTWKFNPAPPANFERAAGGASDWKDIQVPGEWAMQGFTVQPGSAAGYFRTFAIPADWRGRRILLQCDAVHSECTVYVNGKEAGNHLGCFLPFQFDITALVRADGENSLALAVRNESLADTLSKGSHYAKHPIGGILRKMVLFAVPETRLARLQVDTSLDRSLRSGTLELDAEVLGGEADLLVTLAPAESPGGQPLLDKVRVKPGKRSFPVAATALWHAETPALYTVTVDVVKEGRVVETVSRRCGFRRVEVVDRQVLVNGAPVKLKGVCRHSVHPCTGRALTPEIVRRDAELFKDANCNFIRTSHYPPEEEFLDECDRLGLFVMDEGPFCWLGASDSMKPESRNLILRSLLEFQARDRHHPCVIIWSMANESGWSPGFETIGRRLKENDPSRLLFFSHSEYYGAQGEGLLDLGTRHYPNWYTVNNYATYFRPVMFDEFCHVNAYNGGELATDPGIRDRWGELFHQMWDDIHETRILPGVAIWGGIDEVFFFPDGRGTGYGPWGIVDGWRRPKPEYWSVKKAFSPVRVDDRPRDIADGKLILPMENRFDTQSLAALNFRWTFGSLSGTAHSDLAAGRPGALVIAIPPGAAQSGELDLSVLDRRDVLVDRYRVTVGREERGEAPAAGNVELRETDKEWRIVAGGAVVTVNRKTGLFGVVSKEGKTLIERAPFLMMPSSGKSSVRIVNGIPVDEQGQARDDGLFFSPVCGQWTPASVAMTESSGTAVRIRVAGKYERADGWFFYTFTAGGCEIQYVFKDNGGGGLRQTGLVLNLPVSFQNLSWKRKGYWSWYPEDQIARIEGSCTAFPHPAVPDYNGPRELPSYPWSEDTLPSGANDFRSTKHNIRFARLGDAAGSAICVDSDGTEHVRCWMEKDGARMLVANYSGQGSEGFFGMVAKREARDYENPDDRYISDTVRMRFITAGE